MVLQYATCRQMTVGKLSQTTEQVTENILCCVAKLASSLPGGWNNIRSAHIKIQDTPSIPIYVSFGMIHQMLSVYTEDTLTHLLLRLSVLFNGFFFNSYSTQGWIPQKSLWDNGNRFLMGHSSLPTKQSQDVYENLKH